MGLDLRKAIISLVAELILVVFVAFCLWYKLFLPFSYYAGIVGITVCLMSSLVLGNSKKLLILQIALAFVLIRNVYNLSMNFSIIPFGDGNWDYGVVKTFLDEGRIFLIAAPPLLTLYSGWPMLHTLAFTLSSISGVDAYTVALLLPSVFGVIILVFVYLIFEKIRKSLKLAAFFTPVALILYMISPESIFWPMQFVRQNFGMLLFAILIYLMTKVITEEINKKYTSLLIVFGLAIVLTHHLSSLIFVLFTFLVVFLFSLDPRIFKSHGKNFWQPLKIFLVLGLLLSIFLFLYWDQVATMVYPYLQSAINRFTELLSGLRAIEPAPRTAFYPLLLRPQWALLILQLRDVLLYLPAAIGAVILFKKFSNKTPALFVVYSTLSFGLIFVADNFLFRLGITRIMVLGLPFFAFLSAVFYCYLMGKSKMSRPLLRRSIVIGLLGFLVFSSFIGLWGHSFAPLHLYDPQIDSGAVGERNKDFNRVLSFNQKVDFSNFSVIWVDDRSPMPFLLEPDDYNKVQWIPVNNIDELGSIGNEAVYILKDMNLYFYHAGVFSPAETPEQAASIKEAIEFRLENNFNLVYSDGENSFWISIK